MAGLPPVDYDKYPWVEKYADAFDETGDFDFKSFFLESLDYHLRNMQYPPLDTKDINGYTTASLQAINSFAICHFNEDVELPNGKMTTALKLVEDFKLEMFVHNRRFQISSAEAVDFTDLEF